MTAMVYPLFGAEGVRLLADGSLSISLGYFNAFGVMAMVMALFAVVVRLHPLRRSEDEEGQATRHRLSAELPPPPEEIHYSYDFYRPYKRAFAPLLAVSVVGFWRRVASLAVRAADAGRRFYTGDAQTYLVYAVALLVITTFVHGSGPGRERRDEHRSRLVIGVEPALSVLGAIAYGFLIGGIIRKS